jgi:CubicO group peptidase (beta-lactamase class C family)
MKNFRFASTCLLIIFLLVSCTTTPPVKDLPRSTPEAQGVSSDSILRFLDAVAASPNELHSFVLVRHGKVIAEGWWNPYRPDLKHTLYSCSKSFTATAVGFAVSENKLKVTDKVISFLPEFLPDTLSPFLAELTVQNLLTMSVGQDPDPTGAIVRNDSNWVKAFLALPIVNKPGSKFLYNSMATYMLSAIVQKTTGEKVIDYLRPRLFEPLGIEGMDWETDPMGINTGGWGLRLKTEDMAKFGQLFLQKGMWNGKQILASSWVEEASTAHIDQAPGAPEEMRASNDWVQGYCYQMWRCRHNAYRGDGAYGQYIIVMPDQDAVIAITSETPDMQNVMNLVWTFLLPSMEKESLAENPASAEKLQARLAALALPMPPAGSNSPLAEKLNGKTISFDPNELNDASMTFRFAGDSCRLQLSSDNNSYDLTLGSGRWIMGHTSLKGPNLLLGAKGHLEGIPAVEIAGTFSWKDENTLEVILRYIESPHHQTLVLKFDKDRVKLELQNSQDFGKKIYELKGKVIE